MAGKSTKHPKGTRTVANGLAPCAVLKARAAAAEARAVAAEGRAVVAEERAVAAEGRAETAEQDQGSGQTVILV